ncbi:MAG TPA: ATP-dependent 6-phosphofructokinase [Candidatus Obscuribacterales bacterium]
MERRKRIGILTSGGDCPGLNAVIRSVVKCASRQGWDVYGIPYGTDGFIRVAQGLCSPEELKLSDHGYDIPGLLHGLDVLQFLSGSILGSLSRGNPRDPHVQAEILAGYERLGLDALIAIGGDGSLEIICQLAEKGNWNVIGIPKTIDNDVPFTEQSVGYNTAVDTVTKMLYDLTFTAASHDRVMVVQVMGRDAGHLALNAGIAGGADVILIPELVPILNSMVVDQICQRLESLRHNRRKFALVVISEGVKNQDGAKEKYIGDRLAEQIHQRSRELCGVHDESACELTQVDTRSTVLGHIQRSGTPNAFDRLLGTAFGKKAIDLIAEETYNQLVVWRNGQVQACSLDEVMPIIRQCHKENRCPGPVQLDSCMVQVAESLGIYIGIDIANQNASSLPRSTAVPAVD